MIVVGYRPGVSLLHRAHPFTNLTLAGTVVVLAFALPVPIGPLVLTGVLVAFALVAGLPRVLATALAFAAPFWLFLTLIHVVFGDSPMRALTVGGQITAILIAFLLALTAVHPARLVDALLDRGVPFAFAYLLAATLQSVPRLQERAGAILDAQRCRGLNVTGSLWRRARAVVPLAVPLVLGALAEVDERTVALEARGAASAARRTALDPPPDTAVQRTLRWGFLAAAIAVVVARIVQ
jgi:energy-coupling factor transport system permease protein